ncbi:MAG: protein phosphatase 2C domain-containing protein [Ruminococcus sp.]|nr:protein phosphatase 2C domain-containing protein [Ruminococcus sp.]
MNLKTFDITVRGASHVKKGTVCQDFSVSGSEKGWSYAIVCDGHGGDDYIRSDKGSELGCKSAEFMINSMMRQMSAEKFFMENESLLRILEQRIIKKWRETVEAHYNKNPFTPSELSAVSPMACERYKNGNIYSAYGTTLVAVVMTESYWFGIQLGDGKIISVDRNGNFHQPVPDNPECFGNITVSMCDKDAFENFRGCFSYKNPELYNSEVKNIPDIKKKNHFTAYGMELPAAVIINSDGIDNCFKADEQIYNLYKTVLYSFGTSDFDDAENKLRQYLPKLSQQGSGDDISVSAILDTDILPELSVVKEYDMNKQKQRVADAKRRQQEADEVEKKIVAERVARLDREKTEEFESRIEQLEKCLRQTQEKLNESEREYNSLRKDLCRASDSIKICHDCGIVVPKRSECCMKCGKSVTEYRKYTEKTSLWERKRKNSECDGEPDNSTFCSETDNDIITDDDAVRKNTDIDVEINDVYSDNTDSSENVQNICDSVHEISDENTDENTENNLPSNDYYDEEFVPEIIVGGILNDESE